MCDVKDVALVHVLAVDLDVPKGQRYHVVSCPTFLKAKAS